VKRVEHIATTLIEECQEVGKDTCKALRFGFEDRRPSEPGGPTNAERIREEVLDVIGSYQMLAREGVVMPLSVDDMVNAYACKSHRIEVHMPYAVERGTLQL
jgi:hypothetical protein